MIKHQPRGWKPRKLREKKLVHKPIERKKRLNTLWFEKTECLTTLIVPSKCPQPSVGKKKKKHFG